ncbi:hypothetical protein OZK63_38900 [Streptomyces sp. UMAF16]|nr:hypothetical protein [Streptomyces sp. UMAF16]
MPLGYRPPSATDSDTPAPAGRFTLQWDAAGSFLILVLDSVGQVLGLGQGTGGIDAVAFGPPLGQRPTLGGRRVKRRPGIFRHGEVIDGRRLDRDCHFATFSVVTVTGPLPVWERR